MRKFILPAVLAAAVGLAFLPSSARASNPQSGWALKQYAIMCEAPDTRLGRSRNAGSKRNRSKSVSGTDARRLKYATQRLRRRTIKLTCPAGAGSDELQKAYMPAGSGCTLHFTPGILSGVSSSEESRGGLSVC